MKPRFDVGDRVVTTHGRLAVIEKQPSPRDPSQVYIIRFEHSAWATAWGGTHLQRLHPLIQLAEVAE